MPITDPEKKEKGSGQPTHETAKIFSPLWYMLQKKS